jgi:hypothetical protein
LWDTCIIFIRNLGVRVYLNLLDKTADEATTAEEIVQ